MEPSLGSGFQFQSEIFEIKGIKVKAKDWLDNIHQVISGRKSAVVSELGDGRHEIVFLESRAIGNHEVLSLEDVDYFSRNLLKYFEDGS